MVPPIHVVQDQEHICHIDPGKDCVYAHRTAYKAPDYDQNLNDALQTHPECIPGQNSESGRHGQGREGRKEHQTDGRNKMTDLTSGAECVDNQHRAESTAGPCTGAENHQGRTIKAVAEPLPPSLEQTPRAQPFLMATDTAAPAKPPVAAAQVKALVKILTSAGIKFQQHNITCTPNFVKAAALAVLSQESGEVKKTVKEY